ncbi:MAG: insulinase family protein, partial [Polyangiaceae bacterium]
MRSEAAPDTALPDDPQLETAVLPSRVTYYSRRVPTTQDRVVLSLVVKVGSLVEDDDERGFAHFVEHLAFGRTARFEPHQLMGFLQQAGLLLGADANAHTSQFLTLYSLELPAGDPALLDRATALLHDWAYGIVFDPDVIERERSVLLAEKRASSTARARWGRALSASLLEGSRHAERDPLGLDEVLRSATAERLERFYRRWYRPSNIAVIADGQFDIAAMRRRVEELFGAPPEAAASELPPRFAVPVSAQDHFRVHTDADLAQAAAVVALKREARGLESVDDYRKLLSDRLIALMIERRLRSLAQEPASPVLRVSSETLHGEPGTFDLLLFSADADSERVGPALSQLLSEVERLAQHGFAASELADARTAFASRRATERDVRRPLRQSSLAVAQYFALGQVPLSREQEESLDRQYLEQITLAQLEQEARLWSRTAERHVTVAGPDVEHLPDRDALTELAATARRTATTPYMPASVPELLMMVPPDAGSVVARTQIESIDTRVWQLSNGARVVFKPTRFEPGMVRLAAISPGGGVLGGAHPLPVAVLAGDVVSRLGLADHDAASVQNVLAAANVSLDAWIAEHEEGVDGVGQSEHLETWFQALHLLIGAPGHDAASLDRVRARVRQALGRASSDPEQGFSAAVQRELLGYDPRRELLAPESVDALSLDSVLAFYRERFGDVGDFTFVFVGDTNDAALEALVSTYLASLPGSARREGEGLPAPSPTPVGVRRVTMQRAATDKSTVRLIFDGDEALAPDALEDLDGLDGYLRQRLREVLREELGGVYAVDVWYKLRVPPRRGYELGIAFDCKPGEEAALKRATLSVVSELARTGPESRYIELLKKQRERMAEGKLGSNLFWRDALINAYRYGDDPAK